MAKENDSLFANIIAGIEGKRINKTKYKAGGKRIYLHVSLGPSFEANFFLFRKALFFFEKCYFYPKRNAYLYTVHPSPKLRRLDA